MNARRGRAFAVGPEAAAQRRADQRAHHGVDIGAAAAGFFRGFQFA